MTLTMVVPGSCIEHSALRPSFRRTARYPRLEIGKREQSRSNQICGDQCYVPSAHDLRLCIHWLFSESTMWRTPSRSRVQRFAIAEKKWDQHQFSRSLANEFFPGGTGGEFTELEPLCFSFSGTWTQERSQSPQRWLRSSDRWLDPVADWMGLT